MLVEVPIHYVNIYLNSIIAAIKCAKILFFYAVFNFRNFDVMMRDIQKYLLCLNPDPPKFEASNLVSLIFPCFRQYVISEKLLI